MLSSKPTTQTQQTPNKSFKSNKQMKNSQRNQFIKMDRFLFGK
jgi:hypothetical protein